LPPIPSRKGADIVNEPGRRPPADIQTGEERRRRRSRALLEGGATLAAALGVMALHAPKLPPLQGD
jgi:hypothetical protein